MDTAQMLFHSPACFQDLQAIWLSWPHNRNSKIGFSNYREILQPTYIEIVKGFSKAEGLKTRIIVFDQEEKDRLEKVLHAYNGTIEIFIIPTDDIWIRDNGPAFVRDEEGSTHVVAWGFNGWGGKGVSWNLDNELSVKMAEQLKLPLINLKDTIVTEGGSHVFDGYGSMFNTRSSNVNPTRNPNMSQQQIERVFEKYMGIKRFIWLDGKVGVNLTDFHLDSYVRYIDKNRIFTLSPQGCKEIGFSEKDIKVVMESTDINGKPYEKIQVPLSAKAHKVMSDPAKDEFIMRKGSYLNYVKGNNVVLIPAYGDPNDQIAQKAFEEAFPNVKVIPIDIAKLNYFGGMLHCITQHQAPDLKGIKPE